MEVIKVWGKMLPNKTVSVLWAQLCKNYGCIYIKCWERIQGNEKELLCYGSRTVWIVPFLSSLAFFSHQKYVCFTPRNITHVCPSYNGFLANSDHQSWIPFVDMTVLGWGEQGGSLPVGGLLLWTLAHKSISILPLCILTSGAFSLVTIQSKATRLHNSTSVPLRLNVCMNHQEVLSKWGIWFSRRGMQLEMLHF